MKSKIGRAVFILLIAFTVTSTPRPAAALDFGEVAGRTIDAVFFRPAGVVRMIGGVVLLHPAMLFNAIMSPINRDSTVWAADLDRYVIEPFEYVFTRPLDTDVAGG